MVFQTIKGRAEFDNIESVVIPLDHDWRVDVEVDGEVRKDVLVCKENEFEIPNSRNGFANLLLKIDKNAYATINIVEPFPPEWTLTEEDKSIVCFECRGCSIVQWNPSGFYKATTGGKHVFDHVELDEGEWCDFNPESQLPVSVLNVVSRVENYRPKT